MANEVAPTALLADLVSAAERAMGLEGVPKDVRRRVINRLVYGHPDGAQAHIKVHIDQQLEQGTEAMRIFNQALRQQQMRQG